MISRLRFWWNADRVGPDIPLTHWMLHFPKLSFLLSKKKFGQFGDGSVIRPGVYCVNASNIFLGKNITIRPGSMFFADSAANGSIKIADNVLIGSSVHIYVTTHKFSDPSKHIYYQGFEKPKSVNIEEGCWIGANSTILPGVSIGMNSVIGAGSIVTKDVPRNSLVAGNPAKLIRFIE